MDLAVEQGFIDAGSRQVVVVAETVEELMVKLDSYRDPLPDIVYQRLQQSSWRQQVVKTTVVSAAMAASKERLEI